MKDSIKIIGIHKQECKNGGKENYARFIYPIFNILKDDVDKMKINNEKNIYEKVNYYLGDIKNDLPNGKGKEYDCYGKLRFEGEYSNGKKNGKGKAYDSYYKVEFEGIYLNGKRWNGRGKEYDYDNKIIFDCEYLNGQRWNGKGKEFFYGGILKFEGEYLNGKKMEDVKNIIIMVN